MAINTGRTKREQEFAESLAKAIEEARRVTGRTDLPVYIDIGELMRVDKVEFDSGDDDCRCDEEDEANCKCPALPKIVVYSLDH
jgi:hypothetical protein